MAGSTGKRKRICMNCGNIIRFRDIHTIRLMQKDTAIHFTGFGGDIYSRMRQPVDLRTVCGPVLPVVDRGIPPPWGLAFLELQRAAVSAFGEDRANAYLDALLLGRKDSGG